VIVIQTHSATFRRAVKDMFKHIQPMQYYLRAWCIGSELTLKRYVHCLSLLTYY